MKLNVNQQAFITGKVYKLIRLIAKPIIKSVFNPIILNENKEVIDGPILLAPNHRNTLDPFFISVFFKRPIHWVALKRFFTGEDSIFNNSKKPILCKATVLLFNGIGAIPVIRERDVDFENKEQVQQYNQEGRQTISTIGKYLKHGECVGIFPEETTNKDISLHEVQEPKRGFILFAKKSDAIIQPISITWLPKQLNIKRRVIINFRPTFKVGKLDKNVALELWNNSVLEGIEENKALIEELSKIDELVQKSEIKKLILKFEKHL